MGNPKRYISRSSDYVSTKGISPEGDERKINKKKIIEKDIMEEFENNIKDQIKKTFSKGGMKPSIKKDVPDKSQIIKTIEKKGKESMNKVLSELGAILKTSSTQVDKNFSNLVEEPRRVERFNPEEEVDFSDKIEKFQMEPEEDVQEEDVQEEDVQEEDVQEEDVQEEDKENVYDYSKPKNKSVPISYIKKKSLQIVRDVKDPELLYTKKQDTRVIYVSDSHPLFKKVRLKIMDTLNIIYVREGSLIGLVFSKVFNKLYQDIKDCFFLTEPCFSIQTKEYKANIVLIDIILDYKDTAYYVFAEVVKNKIGELVGTDSVKLKNIILVNVDIIFSF